MLVRKYQGRSGEEAIAKAKAELGPEAIILHIKQLSENGIFGLKSAAKVEVIVAIDHDLNEFTQHKELPTMPTLSTNHQSPITNHQSPITNHQNSPLVPAERFRAYAISTYSNIREGVSERPLRSSVNSQASHAWEGVSERPLRSSVNSQASLGNSEFGIRNAELKGSSIPQQTEAITESRKASVHPVREETGVSSGTDSSSFSHGVNSQGFTDSKADRSSLSSTQGVSRDGLRPVDPEGTIPPQILPRLGAAAQELYQHLLSHEVQEEVAQRLSLSIQELLSGDSSLSLKEAMNVCIEELIRTSGGLNIAQKPAVVAFIGPTGVGKTTTIAKLAAHYHLRENQRISLITVDTYRIAAIEQLKTYATYIGIPLEVALTPQEMHQLVRKHKNCDLILIDTPGRSQKDSFRIQELKMILSAASPQEVHLLLNVTTQHRVLWDVVRGFKVFSPNRLLFTKLDESACFGHILNLSVALGEPVSYLTTGQDVPDDIQMATIERITEYLLREGDI